MPAFISQKIPHSTGLTCAQALILQAISALHGRLTRACIARRALQSYSYAYNSYRKGKLRVYLIITLSKLKVSGAHAPLGPTVDALLVHTHMDTHTDTLTHTHTHTHTHTPNAHMWSQIFKDWAHYG